MIRVNLTQALIFPVAEYEAEQQLHETGHLHPRSVLPRWTKWKLVAIF
jgi:hypothetical protein